MGREKRARLKRWSKNTRRTCRCSHHHESAYPRRSKSLQQTTNATLTTTVKESAWSYECMHDMANMMQCNLSKLSGIEIPTYTYMVQVVLLHGNFKCWLAWRKQGMGENQPEVGWLGGWLYPQPTRVRTPGLTSVCLIKAEYSFSGRRRSRR
jgi:hypothetical protein